MLGAAAAQVVGVVALVAEECPGWRDGAPPGRAAHGAVCSTDRVTVSGRTHIHAAVPAGREGAIAE